MFVYLIQLLLCIIDADGDRATSELAESMSAERKILKDKLEIFARMLLDSKVRCQLFNISKKYMLI